MRKRSIAAIFVTAFCVASFSFGATGCSEQSKPLTPDREVQVIENEASALDYENDAVVPLEEAIETYFGEIDSNASVTTRVEGTNLITDVQLPGYPEDTESETLKAAATNVQTDMESVLQNIEDNSMIQLTVSISVYNSAWNRVGFYEL